MKHIILLLFSLNCDGKDALVLIFTLMKDARHFSSMLNLYLYGPLFCSLNLCLLSFVMLALIFFYHLLHSINVWSRLSKCSDVLQCLILLGDMFWSGWQTICP